MDYICLFAILYGLMKMKNYFYPQKEPHDSDKCFLDK